LGDLNLEIIKTVRNNKNLCLSLHPDNVFKATWDIIGLIFLIYQAVMIPFRVSFNYYAAGTAENFEKFIDFFFLFDICNFH
jgi:hypothetical protein